VTVPDFVLGTDRWENLTPVDRLGYECVRPFGLPFSSRLAKLMDSDTDATQTIEGAILGTAAYLAPGIYFRLLMVGYVEGVENGRMHNGLRPWTAATRCCGQSRVGRWKLRRLRRYPLRRSASRDPSPC
jgi:hypothetical protein